MTDDYMSRLDDMLGEKVEKGNVSRDGGTQQPPYYEVANSKSSIHPLWKFIDTWGGTMYLKARHLTLWSVEP